MAIDSGRWHQDDEYERYLFLRDLEDRGLMRKNQINDSLTGTLVTSRLTGFPTELVPNPSIGEVGTRHSKFCWSRDGDSLAVDKVYSRYVEEELLRKQRILSAKGLQPVLIRSERDHRRFS